MGHGPLGGAGETPAARFGSGFKRGTAVLRPASASLHQIQVESVRLEFQQSAQPQHVTGSPR